MNKVYIATVISKNGNRYVWAFPEYPLHDEVTRVWQRDIIEETLSFYEIDEVDMEILT